MSDAELPFDPLYITFAALQAMAATAVYFGSKRSAKPTGAVESLSTKDAAMFPVYGSCALLSIYIVFKFVREDLLNQLLAVYFGLVSVLAVANLVRPWVQSWGKVLAGVFGIVVVGAYFYTSKNWMLNNLVGMAFSITGIEYINLPHFKAGAILLSGLFVYDIFWVFGTEVMVFAAKKLDAPVKVLFPRNILADEWKMSMLGLGDIVIPGIFVALMLRFDMYLAEKRGRSRRPATTYFNACFVAYNLGLTTTMLVMKFFEAAQPALLYLVPFCLLSVMFVALVKGDWAELMEYKEEEQKDAANELGLVDSIKQVFMEGILGIKPDKTEKKE
eukprot:NODE_1797_length_1212_cov_58.191705_g1782_i0.p1 GENE.NODE_1797_length_1212_cov_58.191705_g1782_i0~~NODE_1797_length_1212_cov_58.191705_g1782_i0.p1  ORF type:complete len:331 (+),score=93.52 NODE_1797_length_1212_cov_58.191705_g1782_i0:70-1062(+)